jgi:hypothetical protein
MFPLPSGRQFAPDQPRIPCRDAAPNPLGRAQRSERAPPNGFVLREPQRRRGFFCQRYQGEWVARTLGVTDCGDASIFSLVL